MERMANNSHITYNYFPLINTEIRLLKLQAGSGSDQLTVELLSTDLDTSTEYEALSYQWGSPVTSEEVYLSSGERVLVTKSLHSALLDLRREHCDRIIWADGICINQQDVIERQNQVALMGQIYMKASRVVTYIGHECDESTEAIEFAEDIMRRYAKAELGGPELQFEQNLVRFGLPPIEDSRYAALKAVILRGWCCRSWCAQEFLFNENLVMLCGTKELKWTLLPNLLKLSFDRALPIFLVPNASEDPQDRRQCLLKLNYLRHRKWPAYRSSANQKATAEISFHRMLELMHPFQASDPRDKIYALYGLLPEEAMTTIPVDYQRSVEELYLAVAVHIVQSTKSLEILYNNLGSKQVVLPSWVPDWSTWQVGSHDASGDLWFNACGGTTCDFTIQPNAKLDVMGCIVDRVTKRSEAIGPYFTHFGAEGQLDWIQNQLLNVRKSEPHPIGIDSVDVLWRTLISYSPTIHTTQSAERRRAFDILRTQASDTSQDLLIKAKDFVDTVRRKSRYRCLATTLKRYMAAVPETAEVGDWICMFHGLRLLFVIRQIGPEFKLVGHAYVDGLMSGEVLNLKWYRKCIITLI